MARREKGNGTISQRKDGTWTGRMFLGYKTDGKQKIKAVYGKTEKEVKKKLKELQIETRLIDSKELLDNPYNKLINLSLQLIRLFYLIGLKSQF